MSLYTYLNKGSIRFTVKMVGLVALFFGAGTLGIEASKFIRHELCRPHYSDHTNSPRPIISFRDDLAPGMSAFIEYDKKTVTFSDDKSSMEIKYDKSKQKMTLENADEDSCDFYIPEEALDSKEFTVFAIDRHGNKSRPKKLYTLNKIILEKKPY